LLDYGNRWYNPTIGRFSSIDRFAEKYSSITPYHYTLNNPIVFIDVEGDSVELIIGRAYTDRNGLTHKYGHVALRVYNSEEGYDNVYDFGRYASVWGFANHKGDGILNVHSSSEEYKKLNNNAIDSQYDPRELLKSVESSYEKLGFTKRTEYLKGGGVKITYERKEGDPPKFKSPADIMGNWD